MDPQLEKQLIDRAKNGDMKAYEQLYRAFSDPLYHRIIRPRVPTNADAEDVLVDTFVSALEALGRYQWTGRSMFGWLARIATNKCHDVGRRAARSQRAFQLVETVPVPQPPTPHDAVVQKSDRQRANTQVQTVLAELNPRYAKALQLRLLEGRSREDCAETMAVKVGTFDVLVLRATRAFRKNWDARYGAEES